MAKKLECGVSGINIMGMAGQVVLEQAQLLREAQNMARLKRGSRYSPEDISAKLSALIERALGCNGQLGALLAGSYQETSSGPDPREAGRNTVLVVDDEETVRLSASVILKKCGFDVLLASDGLEAISLYEQCSDALRCVLLDYSMPYISGNLVFARMYAIDDAVPIVVMTGLPQSSVEREFEHLRVAGMLQKPFDARTLIGLVQTCAEVASVQTL
ncbi:MAG: response regulator [Oligoflexia bacterium]|nr:response regulator [Oligoflexia bacterium]